MVLPLAPKSSSSGSRPAHSSRCSGGRLGAPRVVSLLGPTRCTAGRVVPNPSRCPGSPSAPGIRSPHRGLRRPPCTNQARARRPERQIPRHPRMKLVLQRLNDRIVDRSRRQIVFGTKGGAAGAPKTTLDRAWCGRTGIRARLHTRPGRIRPRQAASNAIARCQLVGGAGVGGSGAGRGAEEVRGPRNGPTLPAAKCAGPSARFGAKPTGSSQDLRPSSLERGAARRCNAEG